MGSKKGRSLRPEEEILWRAVQETVKPLGKKEGVRLLQIRLSAQAPSADRPALLASPPPTAAPGKPENTALHPPRQSPAPSSSSAVAKPGQALHRRERRKIIRGKQDLDARLDLHGLTQAQAHDELLTFLRKSQHAGHRLVLVITGKGRSTIGGFESGVLRRLTPLWLAQAPFRSLVLGFEEAHQAHGGEGALYVRLRRL